MNTKRGIVGTIVLIVVALILLGYFQIDIKAVFENPTVQSNLSYAFTTLLTSVGKLFQLLFHSIRK